MPISQARLAGNKRYLEKLEEIKFRVPKGQKAVIQAHAGTCGESVNGFIGRAINETVERDKARQKANGADISD